MLACCECRFEPGQQHGYLSLFSVVFCQVQVLQQTSHSSKGVLLSAACPMSVTVEPKQRGGLDPLWLLSQEEKCEDILQRNISSYHIRQIFFIRMGYSISTHFYHLEGIYEGRTQSHKQLFFAYELGTADEGECSGRWNQLLCYP